MTIWDIVKPEFTTSENWGNTLTIDRCLVMILYCIRCDLKFPMVIHCGVEKRASGYHPKKMAVDWHFVTDLPLAEQYIILEGYLETKGWDKLVGLGVYPTWNQQGFHLDNRGFYARWGQIRSTENFKTKLIYTKTIEEALTWGRNR